jgi:hypothetical protein
MTKEEQQIKADLAKAEEEKAKALAEGGADEGNDDEGAGDGEDKPDYEAELKIERERREAAEKAAADNAFKLREERRKKAEESGGGGNDDEGEDKPLTAKQLQEVLERDRQQNRKEMQADAIQDKAKKLASSDAEASLIVEIHKNRTFPAGMSLEEQVEESWAIANRKRFGQKEAELKRALRGKETAQDSAAGTYREPSAAGEPKMPPQDRAALVQAGFKWDGAKGAYKKPLPRGGFLYNNPRTKKTWREAA